MVQVNGAAARLVAKGDKVIVVSYAEYTEQELEDYEPVVVHVDEDNRRVSVDNEVAKLLGSSVVQDPRER
jgi:aspartate 1-decarboxylase